VEKQYTYNELVPAALLIQPALCMHDIVIYGVPHSASFSTSHKWYDFWGDRVNIIGHKMCVLFFFATFV
jgi:hypothetical protein